MSWLRSSCSLESLQDESHYHDRKFLLDTDDDSSEEVMFYFSYIVSDITMLYIEMKLGEGVYAVAIG